MRNIKWYNAKYDSAWARWHEKFNHAIEAKSNDKLTSKQLNKLNAYRNALYAIDEVIYELREDIQGV